MDQNKISSCKDVYLRCSHAGRYIYNIREQYSAQSCRTDTMSALGQIITPQTASGPAQPGWNGAAMGDALQEKHAYGAAGHVHNTQS